MISDVIVSVIKSVILASCASKNLVTNVFVVICSENNSFIVAVPADKNLVINCSEETFCAMILSIVALSAAKIFVIMSLVYIWSATKLCN